MKEMTQYTKVIIDPEKNSEQVQNLKDIFGDTDLKVWSSMEAYLDDGHMLQDETVKTWKNLYYNEYINRREVVFVIADMGEKRWRKYVKSIAESQFYPMKIFRIGSKETWGNIISKIHQRENDDRSKFHRQYMKLVGLTKDEKHTSYQYVVENIERCPYCKGESFKVVNDINELEKTGKKIRQYNGWFFENFVCSVCNEKIVGRAVVHISGVVSHYNCDDISLLVDL